MTGQREIPERLLFREMLPGDYRKLEAQSNDAPSGGGARDLRIPHEPFEPITSRLFPETRRVRRRRGGEQREISVRVGRIWRDDPTMATEIAYEPPTDARDTEGRIPTIHRIPALANPPEYSEQDPVFLIIVQAADGSLGAHYVRASELRGEEWNPDVRRIILSCHKSSGNRTTIGAYDWLSGEEYCHGGT